MNLSSHQLSRSEEDTLNLGLSFCPRQRLDKLRLCQDTVAFNRRVKLREYFSDRDDPGNVPPLQTSTKAKPPSVTRTKWTPPSGRNPYIDHFTSAVERHLDNFLKDVKENRPSQREKSQHETIRSLKSNSDIVIKPADKGGAVVIQDIKDYTTEAQRQLTDQAFYSPLPEDPTPEYQQQIHQCVNSLKSVNVASSTLVPEHPRVSKFYLLPKIHKLPQLVNNICGNEEPDVQKIIEKSRDNRIIPPGRPIVSSVDSLTEPMSKFVDEKLQAYLPKIKSYTKDTTDFLNKIKSAPLTPDSMLVTMDVKSLYSNIPHDQGVEALRTFLQQQGVHVDEISDLCSMTDFILKHNYFTFNEKYYLQSKGTAMGTKMAPAYANLFMAVLEEDFLSKRNLKPSMYIRYIDDIFMIWPHSETDLMSFLDDFNAHNPNIQFTMEHSREEVHFLDVSVSMNDNELATRVYVKPTDSFTYLDYRSFHPSHTKQSIVYSQMLRYRRITSDPEVFEADALNLGKQFIRLGYPTRLVQHALTQVKKKSRIDLLSTEPKQKENERIPFVTTYHPQVKKLVSTTRREWAANINLDHKLSHAMGESPLHSQRQPPNLRGLLVSSDLPKHPTPKGNKKCGKPRCQVCQHITTDSEVKISQAYSIRPPNHTCDASNVLYCIMCAKCPGVSYIGETSTKFRTRFNNHKSSIAKNRKDFPVATHFNLPNHTIRDVKVCIFGGGYKSAEERKWAELRHIIGSRTFETGLNKDLSWMNTFTFYR